MYVGVSYFSQYLILTILYNSNWAKANTSATNIIFDLPDLIAIQNEDETHSVQIEAFKSIENDIIIRESNSKYFRHLMWVSIGNPKLVYTFDRVNQNSLFHFFNGGFYTYVQMLTEQQRKLLRHEVEYKHSIKISIQQIVNLPLTKFTCAMTIYEHGNGYPITGAVTNFHNFPLRLDFQAPVNTPERQLFEQITNTDDFFDLPVHCEIASEGDVERQNTFTLTTSQLNDMNLIDELFGPANSTYVTRQQMNVLTKQVYSHMNVIEDYEMPEMEFRNEFIEAFIEQVSNNEFKPIDFDMALSQLSKYALNFHPADLRPDVIKNDMGRIFKVIRTANHSVIRLDMQNVKHLANEGLVDFGGGNGVNASFMNMILIGGGGGGLQHYYDKNSSSIGKSLVEQLNDLNHEFRDGLQWDFVGERILPKSLNVARLLRSSFTKNLKFNRIRKVKSKASFIKRLSIYANS
jgi:hypothetical protein